MNLGLRVHPEAAEELDAAIAWHDQGGSDRGEAFEAAYDGAVDRCLSWPGSGSVYPLEDQDAVVRTARVGRSLFRIVYFVENDDLWGVAPEADPSEGTTLGTERGRRVLWRIDSLESL